MRNRARILAITTFASASILALGYGIALAQNTPPAGGGAPVTGGLSGTVNLSPEEISKQAESSIARMEMNAMQVQRMLEKADQEGDAVKLDCLNDKLNVIDTRLRAAKDRKPLLDGALRAKDNAQATTFLQVMQNHQEESGKARAQADNCIGTDVGILGDTKTTTTIDPDIPEDNGEPPPILNVPGWGVDIPPGTDPSQSL